MYEISGAFFSPSPKPSLLLPPTPLSLLPPPLSFFLSLLLHHPVFPRYNLPFSMFPPNFFLLVQSPQPPLHLYLLSFQCNISHILPSTPSSYFPIPCFLYLPVLYILLSLSNILICIFPSSINLPFSFLSQTFSV